MLPKTNQQKYPNERNWHQFAACRKMDPNLFCSWESKEHAVSVCRKCVVSERCREEPNNARAEQNISLIGIWGGMWEPLDLPKSKPKTRTLHERMLHESDSEQIWHGLLHKMKPLEQHTQKDTYLTAIQLKDTGAIQQQDISKTKWKVSNLPIDIYDFWRYLVNLADINGDISFKMAEAIDTLGFRNQYQVYRYLTSLCDMNVLHNEGKQQYRIDLQAIGA